MTMFELVRNFGPTIAITISCIGVILWIVHVLVKHSIKTLDQTTIERKELTDSFTHTINNHLKTSTEKNIEQTGVLKGLIQQFIDFRAENRRYHGAE